MTQVTSETLFTALLAWDAWEQAAVRAADLSRDVGAADYRARVDAAWTEVERLHEAAKAHQAPRATLRQRSPEERVVANALATARAAAEERVRAYTADVTAPPAGGEDADG